jgi:hypothetical protein
LSTTQKSKKVTIYLNNPQTSFASSSSQILIRFFVRRLDCTTSVTWVVVVEVEVNVVVVVVEVRVVVVFGLGFSSGSVSESENLLLARCPANVINRLLPLDI